MTENEFIGTLKTYSYCRLKPSPISGIGVFAIRHIVKGINPMPEMRETEFVNVRKERLEDLSDELKKLVIDMWPENDGVFEVPSYSLNEIGISFYLNHSKTPNMDTNDGGDFYALRDIEPGEELTVDYGTYGELNL